MTDPLDRDALLRRLRDAPPAHLRKLARMGDEGAPRLFPGMLDELAYVLAHEPEPFDFSRFTQNLWRLLQTRDSAPNSRATRHHIGVLAAMTWWLIADGAAAGAATTRPGGELLSALVVDGDLTVEGDLTLPFDVNGPHLQVLGDLTVDGDFALDRSSAFVAGSIDVRGSLKTHPSGSSKLVTGGEVRVGHILEMRGAMFAGGRVEAPLITFDGQGDDFWLMDGVCAVVFSEVLRPGWISSPPEAPIARIDSATVAVTQKPHEVTTGRELLTQELHEELDVRIRAVLHPDLLRACDITSDHQLDLDSPWIWGMLWPALFASGLPLEQLVTPHVLEVFRNRSRRVRRAHR